MAKAFTHYWRNSTWKENRGSEGQLLLHVASNSFEDKGVDAGAMIYVVTVSLGVMFVCGKMVVHEVGDADAAARYLKCEATDLWEAKDHAVAAQATPMRFNKIVPHEVAKELRFVSAKKELASVKFTGPDKIDRQSLRNIRQLSPDSAKELDAFLLPLQKVNPGE